MGTSLKDLLVQLQDVQDALNTEFAGQAAVPRLAQFDSHMATCMMIVEHLFDEGERMDNYRG